MSANFVKLRAGPVKNTSSWMYQAMKRNFLKAIVRLCCGTNVNWKRKF